MNPIIKHDAIPEKYQDELENLFVSRGFPWQVIHENYTNSSKTLSFSHLALNDGPDLVSGSTASEFFSILLPLVYTMGDLLQKEIKKILRIRIGLLLPTPKYNGTLNKNYSLVDGGDDPHVDFFCSHYTGLYYINDSDGDTIIYNETSKSENYSIATSVSPKKGKICIFDGAHYHASSKPIDSYCRLVLTCNFTVA